MRLIDAGAMVAELKWLQSQVSSASAIEIQEYIDRINRQPTIEAAPVVHGRWEVHDHPYIKPRQDGWICTSCSFVTEDIANGDTNYCPNCGARMDGENHGQI